ncbi:MAG: aryl-sulfate sulfotransferase, partial [Crocinitomicaceae bacterium]|nr:aryl-sulfate sulfotransferase [Crocinitomicaceae bacterium]
ASIIQEFNPSGSLVFEWNSLDHLAPDHYASTQPYNVNAFDYLHPNSIELDLDGNLILSHRTANMICKINHQTGDVIWKLGGNYSDFAFINDGGFFGQHDIRVQDNGNLSLFDNDYLTNTQARGVEYELDTINFTATLVNESIYPFNFSAKSLGSYRILGNDYRIVGWGNTKRPSPSITLFDPQGNIASDFLFRDSIVSYRAQFQTLPNLPTRPSIGCQPVGINLELSVSGTHNEYLWSTGQTTPTILISQLGTYQCWVNQGIGMLGSFPVTVSDLNLCDGVGIKEISIIPSEIIGFYDFMGRKLQTEPKNKIYFIYYTNGTIRRQFKAL